MNADSKRASNVSCCSEVIQETIFSFFLIRVDPRASAEKKLGL